MAPKTIAHAAALACLLMISQPSKAFFFIIPIPNLSKPPQLNSLIDALEKSEETKAVAYVSEDKIFGSKQWAWGHFSGHVPQPEANRVAMARCVASLTNAKAQIAGGNSLYNFGTKTCELYSFANITVSPRAGEWKPESVAAPPAIATPAQPVSSAAPVSTVAATIPASAPTAAVTEPSAKPAAADPPPLVVSEPAVTEGATAKKLRELESLRKQGLISEAEYQEKRKAILAAM